MQEYIIWNMWYCVHCNSTFLLDKSDTSLNEGQKRLTYKSHYIAEKKSDISRLPDGYLFNRDWQIIVCNKNDLVILVQQNPLDTNSRSTHYYFCLGSKWWVRAAGLCTAGAWTMCWVDWARRGVPPTSTAAVGV